MIWILLLCHFTADYPLQTDAIVTAKKQILGLSLHVAIHFVTMLIIMVGVLQGNLGVMLPAILVLAGFHFGIDTWKNILSNKHPDWVIFTYMQDQALHIISILLVTFWLDSKADVIADLSESLGIIIPLLGLILVTHVCFITEKVIVYKNTEYQQWLSEQSCSRMIGRAVMLSAWFIGLNVWGLLVFIVGLTYHYLDLAGSFHIRALLIDATVVLCIMLGLSIV